MENIGEYKVEEFPLSRISTIDIGRVGLICQEVNMEQNNTKPVFNKAEYGYSYDNICRYGG